MMPTPSWLTPPNFQQAAQAGASLGAQLRESQGRLGLGYAKLAQSGQGDDERLALRREIAMSKLRDEMDRAKQLQDFREGSLGLRKEGLDQAQALGESKIANANAALGLRESHLGFLEKLREQQLAERQRTTDLSKSEQEELSNAYRIQFELAKPANQYDEDIVKKNAPLLQKAEQTIQRLTNKNTGAVPTTGTSGLQEGQRVRNKTTGQMGTVINGQIVPDEVQPQTPVAEENPYADMGQPVSSGFMYSGPNYTAPAQ